jgi:hypothetical protein
MIINPTELALLMEKAARWFTFTSQKLNEHGISSEVTECRGCYDEDLGPYMQVELKMADINDKAPLIFAYDCYLKITYKVFLDMKKDRIATHYGYFPVGIIKKKEFSSMLNCALTGLSENIPKKSYDLTILAEDGETEEVYWNNSLEQSLNRILLAIDANDIVKKKIDKLRKITFTELEPIRHKYVEGLYEPKE